MGNIGKDVEADELMRYFNDYIGEVSVQLEITTVFETLTSSQIWTKQTTILSDSRNTQREKKCSDWMMSVFFVASKCGLSWYIFVQVMYLRYAGSENMPERFAYIEFTNQSTVPTALQNNGIEFKGKSLKLVFSTTVQLLAFSYLGVNRYTEL